MTIDEALYAHLAADSSIADVVGTRIHNGAREQGGSLPAISFSEISGESEQDVTGAPVGLGGVTVQFDCYAATSKAASALRELVRLSLQGHTAGSLMGGGSGLRVFGCWVEGMSAGYDPDTGDEVRSIDFDIEFNEATS